MPWNTSTNPFDVTVVNDFPRAIRERQHHWGAGFAISDPDLGFIRANDFAQRGEDAQKPLRWQLWQGYVSEGLVGSVPPTTGSNYNGYTRDDIFNPGGVGNLAIDNGGGFPLYRNGGQFITHNYELNFWDDLHAINGTTPGDGWRRFFNRAPRTANEARNPDGYGSIQRGDIVGPWLVEDLRAGFSLMVRRSVQHVFDDVAHEGFGQSDQSPETAQEAVAMSEADWGVFSPGSSQPFAAFVGERRVNQSNGEVRFLCKQGSSQQSLIGVELPSNPHDLTPMVEAQFYIIPIRFHSNRFFTPNPADVAVYNGYGDVGGEGVVQMIGVPRQDQLPLTGAQRSIYASERVGSQSPPSTRGPTSFREEDAGNAENGIQQIGWVDQNARGSNDVDSYRQVILKYDIPGGFEFR